MVQGSGIHHGLRGAEADRDEQFVRELAGQLGLPYTVRHIDAAALALENHLSVEEAGRNARYAFFAETALEGGRIATAHTLDDTIETVLMNLIRGTGLHGLCGIPRTRGNIVRPLLDVTRAEVEEYLALLGQPYCTDSTNLSDDYTRNRVRHDILPRLRELNPNFTGAMARMLPQLAAQWGLEDLLPESYEELGRFMLGPYGALVTRAIHEKHTYKEYIGVDACACNLMRPAMYGAYHHITVLGKENAPCDHVYDVVGSLCENNDKFAIDRRLPKIDMGDLLYIHDTGAHGFSMGYNYNGKLRSAELLLRENGSVQMIRRAETPADYFATLDFSGLNLKD